ncbi:hypothetical protein BaRGS_00013116 [Batillaria attramentaria]|uniref:Uncharacterized protein n=1 Tax=Batillaria attramentaria TaxID=370345 RepID=A0ABD0L969_9CAEN
MHALKPAKMYADFAARSKWTSDMKVSTRANLLRRSCEQGIVSRNLLERLGLSMKRYFKVLICSSQNVFYWDFFRRLRVLCRCAHAMENNVYNSLTDSISGPSLDSSADESRPLLGGEGVPKVYTRRWYLLTVFSLCTLVQTTVWATWGPISQSAEAAFGWHDSDIALFVWMGNVPFAVFCIPLSWLMDHRGLRVSLLLASTLTALGAGLRCLAHFLSTKNVIWVVYGGQFLNGMAGPVVQGGGALFSNLWFPPGQRATSTAIATLVGYMGNSLAFILGPELVPSPPTGGDSNGTIPDGNKQFWLIALAYSIPLGVFETQAGWLGFYSVIGGCATGLVISRFADIFFRQLKLFMVLAYLVSAIFVLWFIIIYIGILPFDMVSIYAAVILSGVFLDGCCPLFYELVCEAAYPVGEGVASCFLQMLCVLFGMAFASVQQIPNVGTTWMNWCLLGAICVSLPLLLCTKETFNRADLDDQEVIVHEPPENPSTQREHQQKAANGHKLVTGDPYDPQTEQTQVIANSDPRSYGTCDVTSGSTTPIRFSPVSRTVHIAIS